MSAITSSEKGKEDAIPRCTDIGNPDFVKIIPPKEDVVLWILTHIHALLGGGQNTNDEVRHLAGIEDVEDKLTDALTPRPCPKKERNNIPCEQQQTCQSMSLIIIY